MKQSTVQDQGKMKIANSDCFLVNVLTSKEMRALLLLISPHAVCGQQISMCYFGGTCFSLTKKDQGRRHDMHHKYCMMSYSVFFGKSDPIKSEIKHKQTRAFENNS